MQFKKRKYLTTKLVCVNLSLEGDFMEQKLNADRHFYLYAKGHYQREDIVKDLIKLQANYCGMEEEYLHEKHVKEHLVCLAYKHIKNEWQFIDFMAKVNNPFYFINDKGNGIIKACLSVLMETTVDSIEGSLGEPDYAILPKRKFNEF